MIRKSAMIWLQTTALVVWAGIAYGQVLQTFPPDGVWKRDDPAQTVRIIQTGSEVKAYEGDEKSPSRAIKFSGQMRDRHISGTFSSGFTPEMVDRAKKECGVALPAVSDAHFEADLSASADVLKMSVTRSPRFYWKACELKYDGNFEAVYRLSYIVARSGAPTSSTQSTASSCKERLFSSSVSRLMDAVEEDGADTNLQCSYHCPWAPNADLIPIMSMSAESSSGARLFTAGSYGSIKFFSVARSRSSDDRNNHMEGGFNINVEVNAAGVPVRLLDWLPGGEQATICQVNEELRFWLARK